MKDDEESAGAEQGTDRPLPAGWRWRVGARTDGLCEYATLWDSTRPRAHAWGDGDWCLDGEAEGHVTKIRRARPVDAENETAWAASQREAEAALWRVDGFGVGEVRGVVLPALNEDATINTMDDRAPVVLPGLPGLWRIKRVNASDRGITVDAVSAPDTQAEADAAPLTHAIDAEGASLCPYDPAKLAYVSQRPERVTCPRCREAMAEPAPREPSAPALDAPVYGYAASEDAEEWSAPYSSREEAISAASEDSDLDGGEIWIVKGRHLDPAAAMPSARWLIEMMPDGAAEQNWYEGAVEALEATIGNLPPEAIAELDAALAAWARRWCPMRGSWEGTGRAERVREASDGDEG